MKITYLHQYFNTPSMSGSTRSFEMARRLVDYGHEVEIITTQRANADAKDWFETTEAGVKVHWLPVPYSNHMGFANRIKAFTRFALAAKARAVSTQPDLVFATSTPLTIAIPGVGAAKALDVPLVFEVRDLWPEMPVATGDLRNPLLIALANRLERYAYMNSQQVVALSPGMAAGVEKAGFPRDRISMIPNSSDIELFTNPVGEPAQILPDLPDLTGKKLVVYCGTIGRVNKVGYLAEIAAQARKIDPKLVFCVIGDGAERAQTIQTASDLGVLGKNMFFFDPVKKNQVPAILAACHMSLSLFADIPAMWSNSANKFFDTLAAGRPIGINYLGWHADLIRDNDLGVVFPYGQPENAAQLISDFLSHTSRQEQAGANALALARSQFDRDNLALQLQDVLLRTKTEFDRNRS